jgi:hypothetical protein
MIKYKSLGLTLVSLTAEFVSWKLVVGVQIMMAKELRMMELKEGRSGEVVVVRLQVMLVLQHELLLA